MVVRALAAKNQQPGCSVRGSSGSKSQTKSKTKIMAATSLLCDVHFWTIRDEVQPKDTDHSTFKYMDKTQHKSTLDRPYGQVKKKFFLLIFLKLFLY